MKTYYQLWLLVNAIIMFPFIFLGYYYEAIRIAFYAGKEAYIKNVTNAVDRS